MKFLILPLILGTMIIGCGASPKAAQVKYLSSEATTSTVTPIPTTPGAIPPTTPTPTPTTPPPTAPALPLPPANSSFTPTIFNPTELAAALNTAQPGAVLALAGGSYGPLSFSGKSGITFKSDPARPALFSSIRIVSGTNIVLDGIKVSRPPAAGDTDNTVRTILLTNCDGIKIVNCDVETQKVVGGSYDGYSQGYSIHVNMTKNVDIRNCNIRGGHRSVMLTYADNIVVQNNEIHDFRAVGVGGGGNNHILIKGNYIHDARPWNWPTADHGDYIHLWDGPNKPPIVGTVIEDNTIDQGGGVPIMGINIQNTQGVYFVDVRLANNLIRTADNQAIRFDGVQQVDVVNNTLVTTLPSGNISPVIPGYPTIPPYSGGAARFQIRTASSGRIENNIWGGIASIATFPAAVSVKNNLSMTFAQQASILKNPKGTFRSDFVALPNGPGAGLGIAP